MEDYKKKALAVANDFTTIRDIQCPRDCKNPGLYFGYIKGYEAALANITTKEALFNIDKEKYELFKNEPPSTVAELTQDIMLEVLKKHTEVLKKLVD